MARYCHDWIHHPEYEVNAAIALKTLESLENVSQMAMPSKEVTEKLLQKLNVAEIHEVSQQQQFVRNCWYDLIELKILGDIHAVRCKSVQLSYQFSRNDVVATYLISEEEDWPETILNFRSTMNVCSDRTMVAASDLLAKIEDSSSLVQEHLSSLYVTVSALICVSLALAASCRDSETALQSKSPTHNNAENVTQQDSEIGSLSTAFPTQNQKSASACCEENFNTNQKNSPLPTNSVSNLMATTLTTCVPVETATASNLSFLSEKLTVPPHIIDEVNDILEQVIERIQSILRNHQHETWFLNMVCVLFSCNESYIKKILTDM